MARKKASGSDTTAQSSADSLARRPLIFLSHDSRDAALAEAFENLLIDASGGVLKAFRSSDRKGSSGIEFGAEWYATIMSRLNDATDVVALLTPNSIGRPWILYEVGVARGKLSVPAFGVTFGVSLDKVSGPFAQFQNSSDDEDSLTKLVLQLIKRNPDATPREEAVRRQVAAFRERVPPPASPPSTDGAPPPADVSNVVKLFEEVKVMFRELPDAVARRLPKSASPRDAGDEDDWFQRAHTIVRDLRSAGSAERAFLWDQFHSELRKRDGEVDGAFQIWRALQKNSDEELRKGVEIFRLDADRRRRGVDSALRHLLDDALDVVNLWSPPQADADTRAKSRKSKRNQPA